MTTFEMLGRERKAMDLVRLLEEYSIDPTDAEQAPENFWVIAAEGAGVKLPSQTTRSMVIQMMRSREGKANGQ